MIYFQDHIMTTNMWLNSRIHFTKMKISSQINSRPNFNTGGGDYFILKWQMMCASGIYHINHEGLYYIYNLLSLSNEKGIEDITDGSQRALKRAWSLENLQHKSKFLLEFNRSRDEIAQARYIYTKAYEQCWSEIVSSTPYLTIYCFIFILVDTNNTG